MSDRKYSQVQRSILQNAEATLSHFYRFGRFLYICVRCLGGGSELFGTKLEAEMITVAYLFGKSYHLGVVRQPAWSALRVGCSVGRATSSTVGEL